YNREWHVVVQHAGLASLLEKFLRWDLEQAQPFQAERGRGRPVAAPDLLIPEEPEEERGATGARLFAKADFTFEGQRRLRVQPLLTPDNYAEHVLGLIKSAQRK